METQLVTLSGKWDITCDPQNNGKLYGWQNAIPDTEVRTIFVPDHIPNSKWTMNISYSNVFPQYHGFVWYYKTLDTLPTRLEDERILLEFERAGYICEVFINGVRVGEHHGHEMRFSFDITEALNEGGKNLLAVRTFEPRATGERLEGIVLHEIPNSCFGNIQAHILGADKGFSLECIGGILGAVHLRSVPPTRVEELWVRPNAKTGELYVTVTVNNTTNAPRDEKIALTLCDKKSGAEIQTLSKRATVPVGQSEVKLYTRIVNHQLWDLDTPTLYIATVSVSGRDHRTTRFGFKEFYIHNGFFFLNGKRIFLKGAHCGITAAYAVSMKALGFNIIRTIARAFNEELLDICDEIGLLVLDAAATGWGMTSHEKTCEMMENYNINMIRRHRNHPSVAAYCLLNELENNDHLFYSAADALPKFRLHAPDTLFLLHSGRWDKQNHLGSASNPGSAKWDTFLGAEGDMTLTERTPAFHCDGYNDLAMGDIHIYMDIPFSEDQRNYFRKIGNGTQPIFVSESGIGSQLDPMSNYLIHSNLRLCEALPTEHEKKLWDEAEAFLEFYDLKNVYPHICDLCRDTERLNGIQRTLLFNVYRSNPMINGLSFTSFGVSHEGALRGRLVVKDSLAYAIQQGHEPLRWSLFTSKRTMYANRPFEVEAVLCNEDFIAPGSYAAEAYIRGKDGCVWKKAFTVDYPAVGFGGMPPLAHSALKESITLPAGEYVFSARLLEGGEAFDGDLKFTVAEATDTLYAKVGVIGVSNAVCELLRSRGAMVEVLGVTTTKTTAQLILVGEADVSFDALQSLALGGATVIFIDDKLFRNNEMLLRSIAGENANVRYSGGSIYHHDHVCISRPVFAGIQDAGVLEFDKYGEAYPKYIYHSVRKPDLTLSAGMRIDSSFTTPGLSLGEYNWGEGKFVLNTYRLNCAVGVHPFADIMLLNMIKHYGK